MSRKKKNGSGSGKQSMEIRGGTQYNDGMKIQFKKPGNMLYPVPAVMVTCAEGDRKNIITVAWAGTVCSDPPMVSVSVKKERYSYNIIKKSGVFVINLVGEELAYACDFCGVKSGRDTDKFEACGLAYTPGPLSGVPMLDASPVSVECRVKEIIPLGSHDMFLAEVLAVHAEERYMDEKRRFHLEDAGLIAYSHGKYHRLGRLLGTFGFSVRRVQKGKKGRGNRRPR